MRELTTQLADAMRDEWLKPPAERKYAKYCYCCGAGIEDEYWSIEGHCLCEECKDDWVMDHMRFLED